MSEPKGPHGNRHVMVNIFGENEKKNQEGKYGNNHFNFEGNN